MKTTKVIVLFLVLAFGSYALPQEEKGPAKGSIYGKELTMKTATPLAEVVEQIDKYNNKEVLIEGSIADVCQRKGCWLMLSDGKKSMRVTFENYSFFVPKDAHNKKVAVQGVVQQKTLSEGMARHYASEQKDKSVRPEDIKGPQQVITMVASGVRIY